MGETVVGIVSSHGAGPRFLIADDHAIFALVSATAPGANTALANQEILTFRGADLRINLPHY